MTSPRGCITCGDVATEAVIVELLPGCRAPVECDGNVAEISVALVDAAKGDRVLVHAGEALGMLP